MYQGLQLVYAYFLAPFRILMVWDFWEGFFCHFSQFNPILFDKSSIAKINRLSTVNDVSVGSPSRIRIVRLISFGITTLPRSSIRLTIPVAFITVPFIIVFAQVFLAIILFAVNENLYGFFYEEKRICKAAQVLLLFHTSIISC